MKRTIYIDDEARELLDQLASLDPSVSVSEWFRRGARLVLRDADEREDHTPRDVAAELRALADVLEKGE